MSAFLRQPPIVQAQIAAQAFAFRVWREGVAVAWDCSAEELAAVLGEDADTIRALCKTRGWPVSRQPTTAEETEHAEAEAFAFAH